MINVKNYKGIAFITGILVLSVFVIVNPTIVLNVDVLLSEETVGSISLTSPYQVDPGLVSKVIPALNLIFRVLVPLIGGGVFFSFRSEVANLPILIILFCGGFSGFVIIVFSGRRVICFDFSSNVVGHVLNSVIVQVCSM